MDELETRMRDVAASVAGGVRAPGPRAARLRGRQRRRRVLGARILAVTLAAAIAPASSLVDLPSVPSLPPVSSLPSAPDDTVAPSTSVAPSGPFPPLTDYDYVVGLPDQSRRTGEIEVVASGERLGASWRLVAYMVPQGPDRADLGVCVSSEFEGFDNVRGCSASSDLAWYARSSSRVSMVAGTADMHAATVRLRLIDGTVEETPAFDGPWAFPTRFFAFVLPYGVDGRLERIEILDDRGRVMCGERVPDPRCV